MRAPALLAASVALLGCSAEDRIVDHADLWPTADALFQSDLRWVGGDGAETIPLGGDRVLWLFGDSLIARGDGRSRQGAAFLRNSVAVQTGLDPAHAFMAFYWSENDGAPGSFLPEQGSTWFWPGQGARLGDVLLLFYGLEHPDGAGGFAGTTWQAFLVDDPDDPPSAWTPRPLPAPPSHGIDVGDTAFVEGDLLYAGGSRGDDHDLFLARWPVADAARGDLSAPTWWCGSAGWSQTAEPVAIIPGAAPEVSIHHDPVSGRYLEFETLGYGDTTRAVRAAPRPEGPWSDPELFLRPPQSTAPDAFVYAGKAHPGLAGADVVLTYVPASFDQTNDDPTLYYPYFARATLVHP